jgi:hypothetical protein
VVQYKPLGNREWEWNETELCSRLLENCYTADHEGYEAGSGEVVLPSGARHCACNKQHCTKIPITALRPPLEFQLGSAVDARRSTRRRTSAAARASPRQNAVVSPGLHQKIVQVLKEDGSVYDEAYLS